MEHWFFRAEKVGSETVLAQIVDLWRKPKQVVRRFRTWRIRFQDFVPAVVILVGPFEFGSSCSGIVCCAWSELCVFSSLWVAVWLLPALVHWDLQHQQPLWWGQVEVPRWEFSSKMEQFYRKSRKSNYCFLIRQELWRKETCGHRYHRRRGRSTWFSSFLGRSFSTPIGWGYC